MTKEDLVSTLKVDLKVEKEVLAIKTMKEVPSDIPHYQGQAMPGMCGLVGEILKEGFVCYVAHENFGCPMAFEATGTKDPGPRDEFLKFMIEQNQDYPMHKDADTLVAYYDKADPFFKHPEVTGQGLVVGPLAKVDDPDLVLLFVTPHQADILSRCRAFLGDFTRAFGGMTGCMFNMRYSFVMGDPCFSTSDTAWRMFGGLSEYELTYTFPYQKLMEIADQIKPTAEYVNAFKTAF
jgi:uncharacterized protein (DUF169 family)